MDSQLKASIEKKLSEMKTTVGIEFTQEELNALKDMFRSTGSSTDGVQSPVQDAEQKLKQALVSINASKTNYCYLHLVRVLPCFMDSTFGEFEPVFESFKAGLGEEPKGPDVLVNLCVFERVVRGEIDKSVLAREPLTDAQGQAAYSNSEVHLKTLAKMLESRSRFDFEDKGGRMHILYKSSCDCKEILCDHGWSPRFILQLITREGQTVGAANINMSELFISEAEIANRVNSVETTPLSAFIDKRVDYDSLREGNQTSFVKPPRQTELPERLPFGNEGLSETQARMTDQQSLRNQISEDLVSMLSHQLDSRTEIFQDVLAKLLKDKELESNPRGMRRGSDVLTTETETDSDLESTIMPMDSSTQLGRYGKSFMRQGPVYTVRKSSTVLEPVNEVSRLQTRNGIDVVKGFITTDSMARAERESVSKVYTINGLARPFQNPRLNFLCHFHTALGSCGLDPRLEPIDSLDHMGSMKPLNPTEELIKQCVVRTFDFDEMTIISNPFSLPFLEIGMQISESCLAKCLSLLRSEYKTLWFQEMKCLKVPSFHDEFSELSSHVIQRGHGRDIRRRPVVRRASNQTSGGSESESRPETHRRPHASKKQRSVLGMPF